MSGRKGSFDGVLTVNGMQHQPYADNATNLDMAMSDGFKNIDTTSLQSPGAATNFTKVSYLFSISNSISIQNPMENNTSFDKTSRNYKTLVAAARHLKLPGDTTEDEMTAKDFTPYSEKELTSADGSRKMSQTTGIKQMYNTDNKNTNRVQNMTEFSPSNVGNFVNSNFGG